MKKYINLKANERFQNETSSSIPPFHVNDPASILDYVGSLIPSVANLPESVREYRVMRKHLTRQLIICRIIKQRAFLQK